MPDRKINDLEGIMAFSNESMDRRPQRRPRRKRRKQGIGMLLGGLTVLALGVGIILFATGVLPLPGLTDRPTEPETEPTAPPETDPPRDQTIHLVLGGDLNVTDRVVESGKTEAGYDYTDAFLDVMSILSPADLAILNFEGTLSGAAGSAPQQLLTALRSAGVDLLQTANSYSVADGLSGLRSAIQRIREAGMTPVGTFTDEEEFQEYRGFTLLDVQGVRVAVVAFTKGMDGMGLPTGSENCVNVLYEDYFSTYQTVDTARITRVLRNVAAEEPDVTLALLHWGSEFNDQISTTQEEIRDLMLEEGVDAIIGTHSHLVQQMVHDREKGTFIAYSLGDFMGNAQRAGSQYSVLLDLQITKFASGETKIVDFDYTPIYILNDGEGPVRVLRLREAIDAYENNFVSRVDKDTYEAMKTALERVEERIAGE